VVNYKNPPISEISFGLSFAPLDGFRVSHYGLFWDRIRIDYPETTDQVPFFNPDEVLPSPSVIQENKFPFPLPRCWYIHRDRKLLIQLQSNRVWFNWRRLASADEYPHFEVLFAQFQYVIGLLEEFLLNTNVGKLDATALELVYVNHIPAGKLWNRYGDVGNFMRDVSWRSDASRLPMPSGIGWTAIFGFDEVRVTADLKAGKEPSGEQRSIYALELRATSIGRGEIFNRPELGWYRRAHHLLHDAFADLTTEEAQRDYWLRTDSPD
jgi:uncharacterized protein (TIGR04255 family)